MKEYPGTIRSMHNVMYNIHVCIDTAHVFDKRIKNIK